MSVNRQLGPKGYRLRMAPEHPRANSKGCVLEHILIVESVIGRFLRNDEEVHHANGDRHDNRNANLVACQDRAYHMLLHLRMRARTACGHAGWLRCSFCGQWDDPLHMTVPGDCDFHRQRPYHKFCAADYQRARARRTA